MQKPVLTPLQRSLLALHVSGMSLSAAGESLFISQREVERQTEDLKRRLRAQNIAQAVLLAHFWGYLALPDIPQLEEEGKNMYTQSMVVESVRG
jgi:DNA-binding CsgD family transcriptional regulator